MYLVLSKKNFLILIIIIFIYENIYDIQINQHHGRANREIKKIEYKYTDRQIYLNLIATSLVLNHATRKSDPSGAGHILLLVTTRQNR